MLESMLNERQSARIEAATVVADGVVQLARSFEKATVDDKELREITHANSVLRNQVERLKSNTANMLLWASRKQEKAPL